MTTNDRPPTAAPASGRDRALPRHRRLLVLAALVLLADAAVLARRVRDYRVALDVTRVHRTPR